MTNQSLRTVALVSSSSNVGALDAVLEAGDYDVVVIESIDRAYSRIKRSSPDVIILCVNIEDAEPFQVLSMLKLDSSTSHIPIITYVTEPTAASSDVQRFETDRDAVPPPIVLSMN